MLLLMFLAIGFYFLFFSLSPSFSLQRRAAKILSLNIQGWIFILINVFLFEWYGEILGLLIEIRFIRNYIGSRGGDVLIGRH